jgi:hypothetical protein
MAAAFYPERILWRASEHGLLDKRGICGRAPIRIRAAGSQSRDVVQIIQAQMSVRISG